MSSIKFGLLIAAVALVSAPSIADAQSFTQRGTRGGAIAGALIGGVIGDQSNNAFTGAVIGGLVGGVTGRAVGKSKDARLYGSNKFYGGKPAYRPTSYAPRKSYYGGGGGYGGGYRGGPSCPYGGRY